MIPRPHVARAILPALVALACAKTTTEVDFRHNREGGGTKVATFHNDSITAEELQERFLEMQPMYRARFQTVEERKRFAEEMAQFELFAAEAVARGLHNDPEVIENAKKVMVHKLIKQEFDEKSTPLTEAEVAAYYEKHKDDYVKPEMIRLSQIFISAAENEAARAEKNARAEELLKKAQALQPLDFRGFGDLAATHSEDEKTKTLRGDMRYLSNQDLTEQYGAEVAEAAKALTIPGQLSAVVATSKGFHILKLQGRQPALNLDVNQARTQIQTRLLHERRSQTFNRFLDELKKKAQLKLHEEQLAKMEVDVKSPAKDSKRPPPGLIPRAAGASVQ